MTRLSLLLALLPLQALAQPKVLADIPPVAGLVAQVMDGIGAPDLLVSAGASPHHYAFRPSDARAVAEADVIFWIGEELSPQIARALKSGTNAAVIHTFLDAKTTQLLEFRDHGEEEDDGHNHDHDAHGHDPHAWMSPRNAVIWLDQIAETLAAIDAPNAEAYRANAAKGRATIEATFASPQASLGYVAQHDAYQYLEDSFGLTFRGAISSSDAEQPSPAHVKEVGTTIESQNVRCVIVEKASDKARLAKRFGLDNIAYAYIDPMGFGIETDANFYPQFMSDIVDALAPCRDLAE